MRSKGLVLLAAAAVAFATLPGCSSGPPKEGIGMKVGDYAHAPGGGGTPAPGAPTPGKNPNK